MDSNAISSFRDHLLQQTFAWCVEHSPFYRKRFDFIANSFRGLPDLPRLPVLFRDDVAQNLGGLLCHKQLPAAVQYTTGTTGSFMPMYRSREELSFIWDFFSRQIQQEDKPRPLYLSLTSAYHGSPTPVPSGAYVLSAGVYDRTQAQQAKSLLEYTFNLDGIESRVSAVIGADVLVKALTGFLIGQGFDLRGSAVKHLILTGGYMSPARKRQLSNLWGATLHDCYSMSEIFGGAKECGIGGPWIFDTQIIPEVVHPKTLDVIDRGVGTLVLSGLYPFTQMMPLVRYYTGDLVEIVPPSEENPPDIMVRFMGRQRRSIIDDSGAEVTPLILAGPLYEILEALPDIMVSTRYVDLQAEANLEIAGKLHYDLEDAGLDDSKTRRITLRLGLRYEPWLFPERTNYLGTHVRSELYAHFAALRERVESGTLRLDVEMHHGSKIPPYNSK